MDWKQKLVVFAAFVLAMFMVFGCDSAPSSPTNADASIDALAKGSCRSGSKGGGKSYGSKSGYKEKSKGKKGGSKGKKNDREWKGKTKNAGKNWCDRYKNKHGDKGNGGDESDNDQNNTPQYDGCVHSVEYWQNNPEDWPAPYQADLQFCTVPGVTYYTVITKETNGMWFFILAHEYIGALLNKTYNGGNIPPEVQEAINEAQLFFHERNPNIPLTEEELAQAQALADLFSDFNDGNFGPEACDEGGCE